MKNHNIKMTLTLATLLTPAISFAALGGLRNLLLSVKGLLDLVIPIVFGLALIYFFWGTAQFILHSGDEKTREDGKKKMLWGIIALFVMFSIFGILRVVSNLTGIDLPKGVPGGENIQNYNPRLETI